MNQSVKNGRSDRRQSWFACIIIAIVAAVAYSNSFSGPFIFDDRSSIEDNATIKKLWPIWPAITPIPGGHTVSGRPILNLSFALNYAAGGLAVWGYHFVNLTLHILAAFTLFGFLWRTFNFAKLSERFGNDSWVIALSIAGLWTLHPVQTESVTYIVQRAESLAGLFYLLTLYCFARGLSPNAHPAWLWTSVAACAVGMGCKEVVASAPLVALLYDRTFVASTFREAWQKRRAIYLAMASTWLLLAHFILATGNRGGSAGFGVGPTPIEYLLTQSCAILEYLRLSIWPSPLIFDYGKPIIMDPARYIAPLFLVGALAVATLIGIFRNTLGGFLGFWFFALLAPTSSIVTVATQTIASHRMYLPLAAVITALVLALYAWKGRKALWFTPIIAIVFGVLTFQRNIDYRTELSIWRDTVLKCPGNARALGCLGVVLIYDRQYGLAKSLLQEAVAIDPDDAKLRCNLGIALCATGSEKQARGEFRLAFSDGSKEENLKISGHLNGLAGVFSGRGQFDLAKSLWKESVRLNPEDATLRSNFGFALHATGEKQEALTQFKRAYELDPTGENKEYNIGLALTDLGNYEEARRYFKAALVKNPRDDRSIQALAGLHKQAEPAPTP